jgi:hypothetical protein
MEVYPLLLLLLLLRLTAGSLPKFSSTTRHARLTQCTWGAVDAMGSGHC